MRDDYGIILKKIIPSNPVALGYNRYEQVDVYLSDFLIQDREITYSTWNRVRLDAEEKLGWSLVTGTQGSGYSDTNEMHPVTDITFYDILLWCNALSLLWELDPVYKVEVTAGDIRVLEPTNISVAMASGVIFDQNATGVRLPTGSEWECAGRGGVVGASFPWGTDERIIWDGEDWVHASNYYVGDGMPNSTTIAGTYAANPFGLYDISGGVWEFTWDFDILPNAIVPIIALGQVRSGRRLECRRVCRYIKYCSGRDDLQSTC